jgi:hypothetical protein
MAEACAEARIGTENPQTSGCPGVDQSWTVASPARRGVGWHHGRQHDLAVDMATGRLGQLDYQYVGHCHIR